MRIRIILSWGTTLFLLLSLHTISFGQNEEASIGFEAKRGFFPSIQYGYHLPGGDMANRFGNNSTLGFDAIFKNEKNWLVGFSYNWMFGGEVKENDMLDGLVGSEGQLIDQDGLFSVIRFNERGHMLNFKGGKIIPINNRNANSGLLFEVGIGAMWHRTDIQASTSKVPQITGDYEKGYDRLNGGAAFTQMVGYQYLDPKKRVNFKAGFQFQQAFTKSLRTIDYDIMEYNDTKRTDLLSGIKVAIIIPLYTKDPEEEQYFID